MKIRVYKQRPRVFACLPAGLLAGLLAGLFSCLSLAACSDDLPMEEGISSLPKGLVEVTLPLTLEEAADGYDLESRKAQTRSEESKKAVDVQLLPSAGTRAADDPLKTAKPDKVYEFHLVQLKPDGTVLTDAGTNYNGGTPIELGKKVTLQLKPSDNCQLIIYARGGIGSESGAAGGSLTSSTWTTFKVPAARINGITDEAGMKNMPYYLHLKQVKVIAGAGTGEGIVQSVTGEDVRLRLRRLAARLNVTWTYNVSGYTLQEVTLQDIPLNYIAIPSTTPKGESKIRALLSPGAGVVTTRHMVQHVVTEYGVAHLRGRNLAERARALIAVAHPSVREELERAAAERFGYSFLRLKA